jgi:hypothetical protein
MTTVSPGVPVPLIGLPLVGLTTGGVGGTVSTVIGVVVGVEVLPARSVAVVDRVCVPSVNGVVGVIDQVPSGLTVVVPRVLPNSSLTVIRSPGVPVPVIVGVLSVVLIVPGRESSPTWVRIDGVGGVVSIVPLTLAAVEVCPPNSWIAEAV